MNYRNIDDMNRCILQHIHILPRNFQLIVGIPRSGMFPANLIALYLNLPFTDLSSFCNGHIYQSGERGKELDLSEIHNVLLVDDSIGSGKALQKAMAQLSGLRSRYAISTCAIYAVEESRQKVDYYFEVVNYPRYFQWNILNHSILKKSCMDIDGVLCADPTEEENDDGDKYRYFLLHAQPLFLPRVEVGTLVTSRLEKYRPETESWLAQHNVRYQKLVMLDLPDMEARRRANCHASFKAQEYSRSINNLLFVESSRKQAIEINRITGKPVLCTEDFQIVSERSSFSYRVRSGQTFPWMIRFLIFMKNKVRSLLR
ncbi:MAG: phosphoribosyl transferase [Bacteroides sp.]|nr:phosphoribosyl transferase [Bacteroides sp.]